MNRVYSFACVLLLFAGPAVSDCPRAEFTVLSPRIGKGGKQVEVPGEHRPFFASAKPLIASRDVLGAHVYREAHMVNGQVRYVGDAIEIRFTYESAKKLKALGAREARKRLALFIDGVLIVAPKVASDMVNEAGYSHLSGPFAGATAEDVARTLRGCRSPN